MATSVCMGRQVITYTIIIEKMKILLSTSYTKKRLMEICFRVPRQCPSRCFSRICSVSECCYQALSCPSNQVGPMSLSGVPNFWISLQGLAFQHVPFCIVWFLFIFTMCKHFFSFKKINLSPTSSPHIQTEYM